LIYNEVSWFTGQRGHLLIGRPPNDGGFAFISGSVILNGEAHTTKNLGVEVMANTLPLNTKKPVKIFQARVEFQMSDGSYVEIVPDATKRSIIIGVLNQLATLNTGSFPTGLEVTSIKVDVGNSLDVVKPA
jgi:hypothetical protein